MPVSKGQLRKLWLEIAAYRVQEAVATVVLSTRVVDSESYPYEKEPCMARLTAIPHPHLHWRRRRHGEGWLHQGGHLSTTTRLSRS